MIRYYVRSLVADTMYQILRLRDTMNAYPAKFREPITREPDGTFVLDLLVDDLSWETLMDNFCRLANLEVVRKEHIANVNNS